MGELSIRLLTPDDAGVAGSIVGIAHSTYEDLAPSEGEQWVRCDFTPCLRRRIEAGEVIVGGEIDSRLVAVYELPSFLRTANKLENPDDTFGWFATAQHGQGIGSAFMRRLAAVFGYAAFHAGTDALIHREQATNSTNRRFFERNGYNATKEVDCGRHVFYFCQREYPASRNQISPLERQVMAALLEPSLQRQTI